MSEPPIDAEAFRAFERAAHDRVADTYHDFFAPVTSRAIDPLLDAAAVGAGSRVLDVATGPGIVAAQARRRAAAYVVGVDLSPRMVALARRLQPGVEFREADVERLPFADAAFDAVVSNFGIGHFPRPERALAEMVRVTVPGGAVAVTWWDAPERARVNGIFMDAMHEVGALPPASLPVGPPPFRFSADRELTTLLRSAGLEAVTVRVIAFTHRLPDAEAWWSGGMGSLARVSSMVRAQPPEVQARIREAFVRLAAPYAARDSLEVPVAVKIATGRRAASA